MRINKYIKILIAVLIVILVFVLIIFFNKDKNSTNYPEDPLTFNSLGTSNLSLDISEASDIVEKDLPVYYVNSESQKERIEEMIRRMSISITGEAESESFQIEWEDDLNYFSYNTITNVLVFKISEAINLDEEESVFSEFFMKYFEEDYQFVVLKKETLSEGRINYYANRLLDEVPIGLGYGYDYTDILKFDSKGNLKEGKVFLGNISRTNEIVPTLSKENLSKYVNIEMYPKESYVDTSLLMEVLDLHYLDPTLQEIGESASDCKTAELDLMYLFKSNNQGYLFPVYKTVANCNVEYEDEIYSVPATFYINAVDPQYLTYSE